MSTIRFFATKINRIVLLALCGLLISPSLRAQVPTTAAAYPFVASQKPFVDLVGGTPVNLNNDDITDVAPIGFSFPFCTGTFTTVTVSSNVWLCLGTATAGSFFSNGTSLPGPTIMPFWDDNDGRHGATASYLTTGAAPNRVFTFEWKNFRPLASSTNPEFTIQVKLYEGGVIECLYKQESGNYNSYTATIGIANSASDYQTLPNSLASPTPTSATFVTSINSRAATGQSYLWGQIPCTGTPSTSVAGPHEVCEGKPFNLGLSGLSLFSGFTYQWQKSTDGVNWTNFAGTVGPGGVITDVLWAPAYYRCIVTCTNSNLTYTTAPHYVTMAPFYYCYCESSRGSNPAGIDVGNVKIVSGGGDTLLNNGTGTPVENNSTANKGYSEFRYSVPPVPMYPDSTYNFWAQQINSGAFTNGIGTIFIDYNRNGRFDYYERVFTQTTMNVLPNPGLVGTTGWQVPKDSFKYYGLTGMRVIMRDGATAPDSCLAYGNGETEDYLIDLRYMPCDGAPNAGKIEGDTSMCAGYDYILTDTSYQTKRHGIERFWQISPDGVHWGDIAGSFNKDTAKRTFTGQPLYYRVGAVCTHTNDTSFTATHKVNLKPTYKCYCHSQSTGTFEDTSDIGAFEMVNFAVGNTGAHLLNPSAWYRRQDYTDMPPIVVDVDSVYNFHVFHTMPKNMHADAKVTVFVDFNNNKRYDIPEERIFTGFTSIGYHTLVKSLVIPNNVIVNVPTGMRVILNNDVAPNIQSDSACGEYTSGETEDFIVMFKRDFAQSVLDVNKGLEHVDVFPNPTTGKFTIQFRSTTAKEVKVTVTSVTGQVVLQQSYQHSGDVFRQDLDLSNQAKGVYMIVLDAGTEKVTKRLTVQ